MCFWVRKNNDIKFHNMVIAGENVPYQVLFSFFYRVIKAQEKDAFSILLSFYNMNRFKIGICRSIYYFPLTCKPGTVTRAIERPVI